METQSTPQRLTKAEVTIDITLDGVRHTRTIRMFDDATLVTRTRDGEPNFVPSDRIAVGEMDSPEDIIGQQLGEMLGPCSIELGNAPV